MAKIQSFEQLECWKTAKQLTIRIYQMQGKVGTDYALRDQLRRAALSVMNNIAEGFGRFSTSEKIRFLEIAQSSANEVKSMMYLIEELNFLQPAESSHFHQTIDLCQRQIWGFIKYLKSTRNPK